ncbi:MAG: murein L,D-transpeptidase [Parvibaculum sp.]|nr:murein L,D-transpeptidase [Parvibaculum sp.]HAC59444.1 murein L,D-transpeptidase [Rhodobiaceae bacterium]|tara:strand:+ start:278 stop:1678 length:1401 start_codon:yes stop_codon:yes gene_type:complete
MAICRHGFGEMRLVSRNGKPNAYGVAGKTSGRLLRGCVKKAFSFLAFAISLTAGLAALSVLAGPVRAETTSYGAEETHWVDPWATSATPLEGQSAVEAPLQRNATPTLSERSIEQLSAAIEHYRGIAAWGGWKRVAAGERLELGVRDQRVAQVRERLMATGDMQASPGDAYLYDEAVMEAVKRYQARNGLEPDGIVGRRTIAAMNVPVHTRIRQLEINLRRLSALMPKLERRYIFVNIAGQEVEAVNNGAVEFNERVIVGKQTRQTPEITSQVTSITFNPYWYVPKSIAMADMLPKIRSNPSYLQRQGIRVLQGWGDNIRELNPASIDWSNPRVNEAYYLRQDPGPWNSLGSLKINFPNNDAIFLHDTPTKTLFGRQERNFSSGCVRVRDVRGLVAWIMAGDDASWNEQRVEGMVDAGHYRNVSLAVPIPIYLAYLTAWAEADGVVNFRDDVYDRDGSVNTSALDN